MNSARYRFRQIRCRLMVMLMGAGASLMYAWMPGAPVKKYELAGRAQGTTYHITYYTSGEPVLKDSVEALLDYMEECFSLYREHSLIRQFNRSARGIPLNPDFQKVMQECLSVFQQTNGLADPTVFPLVQYWSAHGQEPYPKASARAIRKRLRCVGLDAIHLRGDSLVKEKPCLQLDLNGIAQGYSVDFLASYLREHQIRDYIVELGGEIRISGRKQPSGEKFKIAVEQPVTDPGTAKTTFLYLDQGAVTTSGNYRKYLESGGRQQSHIINPLTGYPVRNELISVTVWAENALIADAYDNALLAMGLTQALAFVDTHPFIAAHFVYRDQDGTISDTSTLGMRPFWEP